MTKNHYLNIKHPPWSVRNHVPNQDLNVRTLPDHYFRPQYGNIAFTEDENT